MIAGVRKVMKRRVIKISLAIFVVVGVLLGLLVILSQDWGPEMSFGFLDGRSVTARINQDRGRSVYRIVQETYSFEADFDDVCDKVDAELSALGFTRLTMSVGGQYSREYRLRNEPLGDWLAVSVQNEHKVSTSSTAKSSEYLSPDSYEHLSMEGWVSILVTRGRVRSWPPKYFLMRLRLMLRSNAKKPSPRK